MADLSGQQGSNLTVFDDALNEFYIAEMRRQYNNSAALYAILNKSTRNISGREVVTRMHVAPSEASHSFQSEGLLPDAHYQTAIETRSAWKRVAHSIKIDGDVIAASRDSAGAVISALSFEVENGAKDLAQRVEGMLCRDGSGRLATVSAVGSAASGILTVKHPFDRVNGADTAAEGKLPHELRVGASIGIVSKVGSATTAPVFCRKTSGGQRHFFIVAADRAARTITVSDTAGGSATDLTTSTCTNFPAAGDAIVLSRIRGLASTAEYSTDATFHAVTNFRTYASTHTNANTGTKDIMGLFGIVSGSDVFAEWHTSGTARTLGLQGVSTSSYPIWASYVQNTSSSAVTVDDPLFDEVGDEVAIQGEADTTYWITSFEGRRKYSALFTDQLRYVQTKVGDRFIETLHIQGRPIIPIKDFPGSVFMCVDLSSLTMNIMEELSWDRTGGGILQRIPRYNAYYATLIMRGELTCDRRNAFGIVPNLDT